MSNVVNPMCKLRKYVRRRGCELVKLLYPDIAWLEVVGCVSNKSLKPFLVAEK